MRIDRSNYEIWLVDWLDGNLNDLQVEQLFIFLDENPDLKEEFKDIGTTKLIPSGRSFPHKEILKKSAADLSLSQFEDLSVAFLENDLSSEQKEEIAEIIEKDEVKKKSFELIQKTRLAPPDLNYKNKNQLYRRTTAQKIIRLSVIGLSAAAAVTLVIMTYQIIPRNIPDKINNTAQNIVADTLFRQPVTNIEPDSIVTEINPIKSESIKDNLIAEVLERNIELPKSYVEEALFTNDSSFIDPRNPEIVPGKIAINTAIDWELKTTGNKLAASNHYLNIPAYDDDRSNLSRFLAKTFREKILKEGVSAGDPLKGYEIAEAGVTGLNKLLGWEMALIKNNDENGELQSVYFSSKILKFNAPVKKSVPVP